MSFIKPAIALAHYTALNGSWLYDEERCAALTIVSREGYGPTQSFRLFLAEDLADEGRFLSAADPLLSEFSSARFLEDDSLRAGYERRLRRSLRWERADGAAVMTALLSLSEEQASAILEDPRMEACPIDYSHLGCVAGSSKGSPLGGWIRLWFGEEPVFRCPLCGSRLRPYYGASGLGSGVLRSRCSVCGETIDDRSHALTDITACLRALKRGPSRGVRSGARRPYRLDTVLERLGLDVEALMASAGKPG